MNFLGININVKNRAELDPEFIPLHAFNKSFLATAKKPVSIAVERARGEMACCHTFIHGTPEMKEADCFYIDRLVKFSLWMKGGFRIYVSGDENIYNYLCDIYRAGGKQEFDWDYMANVFEHPFEVLLVDKVPESKHLDNGLDRPEVAHGDECWHCANCRTSCPTGAIGFRFPLRMQV